jgi:hypothetical protein
LKVAIFTRRFSPESGFRSRLPPCASADESGSERSRGFRADPLMVQRSWRTGALSRRLPLGIASRAGCLQRREADSGSSWHLADVTLPPAQRV